MWGERSPDSVSWCRGGDSLAKNGHLKKRKKPRGRGAIEKKKHLKVKEKKGRMGGGS